MNCSNCGKPNPLQAQNCGNCGHSLYARVFPPDLSSTAPEALSAPVSASASQKPGCLGSLLKRVLAMLAATIVGWLCGLVNAALLPAFAQTQDSAWLVTLTLSGVQICLSFVIALGIGLVINRGRRTAAQLR